MRAIFSLVIVSLTACGGTPVCPKVIPGDGSSCEHRGLVCESGGGAHQRCSTIFSCGDALDPKSPTNLAWNVSPPDPSCMQVNDSACPADFNSTPVAKDCPSSGLSCDYGEGRCDCMPCNPSGLAWRCRRWGDVGTSATCPADRPALGTPCDSDGPQSCKYDDNCRVSFGPDLVCFEGLWQPRIGLPRACGVPVCGLVDG
jgi:hypothetical protein